MNTINLFIANASGSLTHHEEVIRKAFDRVVNIANDVLHIDAVDIICLDDGQQTIPETGMSGYTPSRNLVYLYVDSSKDLNEDEIFYTLCHELHHAKRYDGPSYGATIFDSMIFEGLGVAFEKEVSDGKGSFLTKFIEEKTDNKTLLDSVKSHFDDTEFNRFYWFIQESDDLPRWTGYRVGFYIVSAYLKKTNKKASDVSLEDSNVFRDFVRDDLGRA